MRTLFIASMALLLAACATTTSVVLLDPGKKFAPTQSVRILLRPPSEPYVEIAKLESQGVAGEAETAVLEDARAKAGEIGADAIIVIDTSNVYHPPMVVYDPWPYFPWYYDGWHSHRYGYFSPFHPYGPQTHTLPGGHAYTVRAIAIKFE